MEKIDNSSHFISIEERKKINITGVKKLESFDDKEFILVTNMGNLIIKGNDLEIVKLDTYQGQVIIKGHFISLNYSDGNNLSKEGIWARMFR